MTWDLKGDPLSPAKGIKELLRIGLELILIIHIDYELLAIQDIGGAVGL